MGVLFKFHIQGILQIQIILLSLKYVGFVNIVLWIISNIYSQICLNRTMNKTKSCINWNLK
jgi:hypothetical protein